MPGISKGRRTGRSRDPLGDPFAVPSGGVDPLDDDDAPPPGYDPDLAIPRTPPPTRPDVDLDIDDALGGPDHGAGKAPSAIARLFGAGRGARGGSGDDPLSGLTDIDGAPLRARAGGRRGLIAAAVALAVAGGGYGLYAAGVFGGGASAPESVPMAATDAPDESGAIYVEPGRVLMTLPPLTEPAPVMADATAATDRSAARRPWLNGGSQAEGQAPGQVQDQPAGQSAPAPDEAAQAQADTAPDAAPATPAAAEAAPDPGPETQTADAGPAVPTMDLSEPPAATMDPSPADPSPTDPSPADPMSDTMADEDGTGETPAREGVRARVDLAAPDLDLPDVPGVLPVPDGVRSPAEPDTPNRLNGAPPVPSYALIPVAAGTKGNPLRPAPVPALQTSGPYGMMPRIGEDGTLPWQVYAAPDPAPGDRPAVAIVVKGLGMMADALEAAATKLPPEVTLSFSPYTPELSDRMVIARRSGHETMIDLPMERESFPANDPGPLGLLTMLPPPETLDRMQQLMAQANGYVGVLADGDGRFAASPENMEVVLKALRQSGLLYVHQGSTRSLAANLRSLPALTAVDVVVDRRGFAESIEARLDYLTRLAQARGTAVGVMRASPLGFTKLREWIETLEAAGVALVPVSAVVRRSGGAAAPEGPATPPPTRESSAEHGAADHG
nr:divergent polysaccharide deacetylase family protein [Roseospira navarrensis]